MIDPRTMSQFHPSRRNILLLTLGALLAAVLILVIGILPAEYHRDPTGLGKATGIANLWAPAEVYVAPGAEQAPSTRSYATPFRSDVVTFPLATGDDRDGRNELEYKVQMRKGGSFIYSWSVSGITAPDEFYTEFHGHTGGSGQSITVADYRKASGASDNGFLVAPFDGIHGWYFQNQSVSPVRVTLRVAGFYQLIPPGQPGNEAKIASRALLN